MIRCPTEHCPRFHNAAAALQRMSIEPSESSPTKGCTSPAATKRERMSSEVLGGRMEDVPPSRRIESNDATACAASSAVPQVMACT